MDSHSPPSPKSVLEEILAVAKDSPDPGAQALVAQCQCQTGCNAAELFIEGLFRAFGFCAFSLAADDVTEARALALARAQYEGLAWAQQEYRSDVFLEDINPQLERRPDDLASRNARLDKWLSPPVV